MNTMELIERAEITYRQLDYWVRSGYIKPMGEQFPGMGHAREFSWVQVQIATQMARLIKVGFTPVAAARIASPDSRARDAAIAALTQGWDSMEECA